jgi:hypothetical protein
MRLDQHRHCVTSDSWDPNNNIDGFSPLPDFVETVFELIFEGPRLLPARPEIYGSKH